MPREGRLRGILLRVVGHLDAALEANPYLIVYRTDGRDGIGDPLRFDDLVQSELGMTRDDPRRLEFLAWLALDEAARDGHTAASLGWVTRTVGRASGATEAVVTEVLRNAVRLEAFTATKVAGVVYLQLAPLDRAERAIAAFVADRTKKLTNG